MSIYAFCGFTDLTTVTGTAQAAYFRNKMRGAGSMLGPSATGVAGGGISAPVATGNADGALGILLGSLVGFDNKIPGHCVRIGWTAKFATAVNDFPGGLYNSSGQVITPFSASGFSYPANTFVANEVVITVDPDAVNYTVKYYRNGALSNTRSHPIATVGNVWVYLGHNSLTSSPLAVANTITFGMAVVSISDDELPPLGNATVKRASATMLTSGSWSSPGSTPGASEFNTLSSGNVGIDGTTISTSGNTVIAASTLGKSPIVSKISTSLTGSGVVAVQASLYCKDVQDLQGNISVVTIKDGQNGTVLGKQTSGSLTANWRVSACACVETSPTTAADLVFEFSTE